MNSHLPRVDVRQVTLHLERRLDQLELIQGSLILDPHDLSRVLFQQCPHRQPARQPHRFAGLQRGARLLVDAHDLRQRRQPQLVHDARRHRQPDLGFGGTASVSHRDRSARSIHQLADYVEPTAHRPAVDRNQARAPRDVQRRRRRALYNVRDDRQSLFFVEADTYTRVRGAEQAERPPRRHSQLDELAVPQHRNWHWLVSVRRDALDDLAVPRVEHCAPLSDYVPHLESRLVAGVAGVEHADGLPRQEPQYVSGVLAHLARRTDLDRIQTEDRARRHLQGREAPRLVRVRPFDRQLDVRLARFTGQPVEGSVDVERALHLDPADVRNPIAHAQVADPLQLRRPLRDHRRHAPASGRRRWW